MDEDYQLALLLQKELNDAAPEIIEQTWEDKENHRNNYVKRTESLVDPQWEFIDPTPDIHVLFLQFNDRFFWGKLRSVEIKWSSRMTSCAGVCVYQGRSGFCSVRLSLPLLKLRPRKDLVETLLHEMIHAFLFVTKNNRDRDGHGPEFHKHMNRINQEAGTRISVYHSFHDEVRLYQQHWWRCNGPCQHKPPFFGMVRRSTNRAPGPYDRWWAQHQATCGGKYIKVKEPEIIKKKSSDPKTKPSDQSSIGKKDIRNFFPGSGLSSKPGGGLVKAIGGPSTSRATELNNLSRFDAPAVKDKPSNIPQGSLFTKPTMNNVHGFGSEEASSFKPVAKPAVNNVFGFRDLQGQGTKQTAGVKSSQPSGYVLGGSGKPPYQKGRGAYGGMLANKGSGTFVVSGTSNKFRDSQGPSNNSLSSAQGSSRPTQVFSGSGHVLGKGSLNKPRVLDNVAGYKGQTSLPNTDIPVFTQKTGGSKIIGEPPKRFSPNSFQHSPVKKKSYDEEASTSTKPLTVCCPICNKEVLDIVINSHLDECFNIKPDSNMDDATIILSDSEDAPLFVEDSSSSSKNGLLVDCPSCCKKIFESQLDSHLSSCLSQSFEDDDVILVPDSDAKAKCPICGENIPAAEMDKHLDNCASCSLQDLSEVFNEDMSDEEEDAAVGFPSQQVSEAGERVYPCPCCLILIESSKMNLHLDQCVA